MANNKPDISIPKEADEAARAHRAKLFKAESANRSQKRPSLAAGIAALTGALNFEKGKPSPEVTQSFDALREEMLRAAPPKIEGR